MSPGREGPPGVLARLVERLLPPEDRGPLLREMEELYRLRAERDGEGAARRWWRRQAIGFVGRLALERLRGRGGPGRERLDRDGRGRMTGWGTELRHGARRLLRAPVFAGAAVLTLAVGIGIFTAVYAVVHAVLLEPMPYDDPDELVWVWRDYTAWFDLERGWLGGPDVVEMRERDGVFEEVVALRSGRFNLTGREGERPREVEAILASDAFFRTLGAEPFLGRGFLPGEDDPGAAAVAVLGHALWRSQYGGDPGVLGREIYLDGEPTRVVGVARPGFRFVKHSSLGAPVPADLYVTLRMELGTLSPGAGMFAGLARVREGTPPETLRGALDAVAREVDRAFGNRGLRLWSVGLKEDLVSRVRPALLALLGAAACLLLILAANLATLQLGRTAERSADLSVRAALGAGRARLAGSLVTESLLVAVTGSVLGLVVAGWVVAAVRTLAPDTLPRTGEIGVDAGVLAVGAGAALLVGIGASLAGGLRIVGRAPAAALREAGARGGAGLGGARTRRSLSGAQVALSLSLLVAAGLLARAFGDLSRADPGFDAGAAVTFRVPADPNAYPDGAATAALYRTLRGRLLQVPGVEAVGAADALPLSAGADQIGARFPGAPGNTGNPRQDEALVDLLRATPGYDRAAGLRVLEGRFLGEADDAEGPAVAVVDDVLARRFFPDRSPVGASLVLGGPDTLEVVGVVDQARLYAVGADDRGQVYRPVAQAGGEALSFVLRGRTEPSALVGRAREVVVEVDPTLPVSRVRALEGIVDASLSRERLSVSLVTLFALGALLVAALGIYGVVSTGVASRTREVGIRLALGADAGRVVGMLVRQGLAPAAVGALLGVAAGAVGARFLGRVVPGVEVGDPVPYAAVVAVAGAVTLAASYLPARRAARVDPVEALRPE